MSGNGNECQPLDVGGLKEEARRVTDRAMKKAGKAMTQLREARETAAALESSPAGAYTRPLFSST